MGVSKGKNQTSARPSKQIHTILYHLVLLHHIFMFNVKHIKISHSPHSLFFLLLDVTYFSANIPLQLL